MDGTVLKAQPHAQSHKLPWLIGMPTDFLSLTPGVQTPTEVLRVCLSGEKSFSYQGPHLSFLPSLSWSP